MIENEWTSHVNRKNDNLQVKRRIHNGIIYRTEERGVVKAVLAQFPVHKYDRVNRAMFPIISTFENGNSGKKKIRDINIDFEIGDDGSVFIPSRGFYHHTIGIGDYDQKTNTLKILSTFDKKTGFFNGKNFKKIIDKNYSSEYVIHESGRIKENLHINEMPSINGTHLVIVTKVGSQISNLSKRIKSKNLKNESISIFGGVATESSGDASKEASVEQFFIEDSSGVYVLSGVKSSWLENAIFPVVIDPTWNYQPDDTTGEDCYLSQVNPTANSNGSNVLVGRVNGASNANTTLIRFDFTGLDDYQSGVSADLTLRLYSSQNLDFPHTNSMRRIRDERDWVETQATWQIYKTSNNWTSGGGTNTTSDIVSTVSGSYQYTTAPTEPSDIVFSNILITDFDNWIDSTYVNNGYNIAETQSGGHYTGKWYYSSGSGTAGDRPLLELTYTALSSNVISSWF